MTNLVYRAAKGASPTTLVYEGALNTGTTTNLTLNTTQNSTVVLTVTPLGSIISKVLTVQQQSQTTSLKLTTHTFSLTQATTLQVYTDTTLNSALTTVNQNSTKTLTKLTNDTKSTTQTSTITLARVFIGGGTHSTFFITLTTNQVSTIVNSKAIQTIKSVTQNSVVLPLGVRAGTQNLSTTQRSQVVLLINGPHNDYHPFLPVGNPSVTTLTIAVIRHPGGGNNGGGAGGGGPAHDHDHPGKHHNPLSDSIRALWEKQPKFQPEKPPKKTKKTGKAKVATSNPFESAERAAQAILMARQRAHEEAVAQQRKLDDAVAMLLISEDF